MGRREAVREQAFCSPGFFASELSEARERAGLSQGELARLIPCDRSLISRIEAAERVPQEDFVHACDKLLGTGGMLLRVWRKVPWHRGVEHPDWFRRFAEMEAEATVIREYQVSRVSGLLQTPAYARALLAQGDAAGNEDLINERVAARMGRQDRFLADDGPFLMVIVHEAVIRTVVGGPMVMAEQLRHLMAMAQRPNIILQVAPYSLGERTTAVGPGTTLITLPDGSEWLYAEVLSRGVFSDNPDQLVRRSRAYDRLRADALSAPDSARLIRSVMEGLLNMSPKVDLSTAQWFKSSYSEGDGGQCIEAAYNFASVGVVPVRDSKDPGGPVLGFSTDTWQAFVSAVKSGSLPAR
ncbi:helix-turn-helix domain-containing protein [Kitasatospora griseola]|uniref:helix-turn-helix domain-containing protein n=1 Tax=Kitasatospora griseola TaxID=2064 RepID=UPI00381103F9